MLTLPHLLQGTARSHAGRTAIHTPAGRLDWAQWTERVARRAHLLARLGLRPGDRCATLCRNSAEHAELLLGGYWAGIVPIPLDYRLAGADIAWMLENSACRRLLVDEDLAYLLDQADLAPWRGRAACVGSNPAASGMAATETLMDETRPAAPHPAGEQDVALILYTGGTTARGKGVRLTHRNIAANALQMSRVIAPSHDDVYLHVSPMFHSTDLKATAVTLFGGSHVYLREATPDGVLEAIERHRVTIASLLPAMLGRILDEADPGRYDLRSLRLISYGTASLGEARLRQAMAAFAHVGFHQCYGLTETSPYVAILDEAAHRRAVDDRPELLKAAGRVLPGTLLRLVDDAGRDVPAGAMGEIVVAGPQVAAGYVGLPDEEAEVFRDGAFHTGDIGRIDEDGFLYILDRKREAVVADGERVSTREIEEVLQRCPGIAQAAVVGVPDAQGGEALLAVLVAAGGRAPPSAGAIASFCGQHLTPGRVPHRYMFVDGLPRTPLGKVRKRELQEAYHSQLQAAAAARGRRAGR